MAPLPAPAEKPSHRISESQSHAKLSPPAQVAHGAVKDALRLGAIGYDAVKHLVLCRIERRSPKLDLDIYPYLPRANVATTAAASYMIPIRHL